MVENGQAYVEIVSGWRHLLGWTAVRFLLVPCYGERARALKLLRSVKSGMLLMWDRGIHIPFALVQATMMKGGDYLGGIPANVKFLVENPLADGS